MSVQVTVVVPTYKRPELLQRCLQALMSQDCDPSIYEIIVVDDAADPQTEAVVKEWADQAQAYAVITGQQSLLSELPPYGSTVPSPAASLTTGSLVSIPGLPRLHYIPAEESQGPAAARNLGWQMACGDIIAFTDDDCIPRSDWLRRGLSAFFEGAGGDDVAGVSGRVIVPLSSNPTDYEFNFLGLVRSKFVTANCFYRRIALEEVGGFDESFPLAWREDSDLYFRLLKHDYRLVEAEDVIVIHPVRPAQWGISLRQQRKSMYNALLYKKHPQLYRHLQPSPPWNYYGILAALLALIGSQISANHELGLLASVVWLGLTAHFCAQRLRHTSHHFMHILEMVVTSTLIPPLSIYWRLRGALKYRVLFF